MLISRRFSYDIFQEKSSRIESAGKGAAIEKSRAVIGGKGLMRERHLCAILKLYTNSFCRQRAGLEVLMN